MSVEVLLPMTGFSMNEGTQTDWPVADGSQVTKGQPILSLESNRPTNDVESPASGAIMIVAAIGETCEVGTVLAVSEK